MSGLPTIDGEVVVRLADGCTLRSGVYDESAPDRLVCGDFVRLCDPDGDELLFWDAEEWATDPALVMGAIVNAAAGLRFHTDLDGTDVPYVQHTIDTCPYSPCPNDDECDHREYL